MEKKRENWEVEETRFLLKLIQERQIIQHLDGKRFRSDEIFQHLETPMKERGYKKTAKQMQTRFRTLKQQYNKIKRQMGASGSGNSMLSFLYAEEMGNLLDFRPIATGEIVDSTPSDSCDSSFYSSLYEDEPDPRDNAVPGCSSEPDLTNIQTPTTYNSYDSSSESNINAESTLNNGRKRKRSRTNEAIMLRYADKLERGYKNVQEQIMVQNHNFFQNIVNTQEQFQNNIMNNMLKAQTEMLQNITAQLLHGLKECWTSTPSIAQYPVRISSPPSSSNNIQSVRYANLLPTLIVNRANAQKGTTFSVQEVITKHEQDGNENNSIPK